MNQNAGAPCPFCGAVSLPGTPHCPRCGTPLGAPSPSPHDQSPSNGSVPGVQDGAPASAEPNPHGASPWQEPPEEKPQKTEEEIRKEKLKKKITTIAGMVATIVLLLGGLSYIFGFSLPDIFSGGTALPLPLNQTVDGEFTAWSTTQIYQFQLPEASPVTITARSESDIYVELQRDERPIERGVSVIDATLEPGTYQVLVRPLRQGAGAFTIRAITPVGDE